MKHIAQNTDMIVFSQERWGSSFTRTSQIMSRFARHRRVFFFEAPIVGVSKNPLYLLRETRDDVMVVEPYLPEEMSVFDQKIALVEIVNKLIDDEKIKNFSIWTDTPKAVPLFRHLQTKAIIYDCLQDYSVTNPELETEIFNLADLVMTSGPSLYAAKRSMHSNIHNNPDCVDYRHFFQSRYLDEDSEDLSMIPHPRIGFAGTIDEKIDLELLANLATLRPELHFVLAGDVSIDEESLPKNENIHFISAKGYSKLPLFIASCDCIFLPYKVNEENHYLNPSLIPESLIGARPVVSTPLKDVVMNYDGHNIMSLAEFPIDFANKLDFALNLEKKSQIWIDMVDEHFKGMSWNKSCLRLEALEQDVYEAKSRVVFQNTLKELFKNAFYRKPEARMELVQGINLRKLAHRGASVI